MTPISEREPKELEAQAATSHGAPTPSVTLEEETATEKAKSGATDQENQAARRDLLAGIRKLIKSFKSLSHIFEIYKEDGDDEEDDIDMNIEIGFPTDVQHVAHIGLDGSSNVSSLRGLEEGARDLLSLSNLTMEQFELAVASLAAHKEQNAPVVRRVAPS